MQKSSPFPDDLNPARIQNVLSLISGLWDSSIRFGVTESYIRSVPVPHTVPSPSGKFKVLFYWDTYFTNLGLLRQNRVDLAKSNCDAFAWLVDQIGWVPNSVFVGDHLRSQPPYFSKMVREVYAQTEDRAWLTEILPRLEREHAWWMEKRSAPDGLNRHGHDYDTEYLLQFYNQTAVTRLKSPTNVPDSIKLDFASHLVAEAETGWDFTPLFEHRCGNFSPVHLNTLLWDMEQNLAFFCLETGRPATETEAWMKLASSRAQLIRDRLWSRERGLFLNRDFVENEPSRIAGSDTFAPLAFGLATAQEAAAVQEKLPLFEQDYGLACTEDNSQAGHYQWSFPVAWPPMTWLAISGLDRYGYHEDAHRLAQKYLSVMTRFFERDGGFWEKYDVRTGEPNHGEYEADPMLGWCAGVYVASAAMRGIKE